MTTECENNIRRIVEKWDQYNNSAGPDAANQEMQLVLDELKDELNDN